MGLFTGREVAHPAPRSRTLMDAVRDDDRALVAETLARGESVTQTNAYGRTPLHKACYYSGAPAVIEEHIRLGADDDAVDKGNWTRAPRRAQPPQRRAGGFAVYSNRRRGNLLREKRASREPRDR